MLAGTIRGRGDPVFVYREVRDLQAVTELAKSAFVIRRGDHTAATEWIERSVEQGRKLYGVYDGPTLVSVYMLYDYRMRFRSSVVPMGGIGLLCSRLDARGKGAVRFMLARSLETMREAGHVVSVLNPFDQSFYGKYGWEMFARLQRIELAPGLIRVPDDPGIEHKVVDLPYPDSASCDYYNEYAQRHHTLVQRGDAEWEQRLRIFSNQSNTATRGVVRVSREGKAAGLIGYDLSGKPDDWHPTFTANLFLYDDGAAKRALLRYLKGLSHQVKTIRVEVPTDEDLWPYLSDRPVKREIHDQFMIRVVSIEALDGLKVDADDVSLAVDIEDKLAPWNGGIWRLTVDAGVLRVERADRTDLRCGIGALSSILSGFTDCEEAIAAGLVEALPSYAGQDLPRTTPFLADYF